MVHLVAYNIEKYTSLKHTQHINNKQIKSKLFYSTIIYKSNNKIIGLKKLFIINKTEFPREYISKENNLISTAIMKKIRIAGSPQSFLKDYLRHKYLFK